MARVLVRCYLSCTQPAVPAGGPSARRRRSMGQIIQSKVSRSTLLKAIGLLPTWLTAGRS